MPHDDQGIVIYRSTSVKMVASCRERQQTGHPIRDSRGRIFRVRPQSSNIDACVSLSITRCIYSVIGILLVLTDIPRTGLAVNLSSYFATVAPGTAMYYGPYAYPLVHINRTNTSNGRDDLQAFAGDSLIDSVDVWAYKFDTLSIPTRALAERLHVSPYPPCLLYEKDCESSTLSVDTTFSMLNGLMTAMQQTYFNDVATHRFPVAFETISYWADRLHHVLLGTMTYRRDRRIHGVRYFATDRSLNTGERLGVDVCQARSASDRHRPMVCSLPIKWMCDHPTLGAGTQIPIQESIRFRFAALQQQYPDTLLEMLLITTRSPIESRSIASLPTVYYFSDSLEVTTLIRGQRCPPGERCQVMFIDDYRYERATLETSSDEMKTITGCLRAFSQAYIWLRVLLLVSICSQARLAEPSVRSASMPRKAAAVALTLLRIPSHVIVYSSWLPVIVYSLAHLIDCGLVHLITENFWSSTNGFFSFDLVGFIVVSSVQMRNIWPIALLWKLAVSFYSAIVMNRNRAWRPQYGVLAFRGVFVGSISGLTTLSFMRALRFRNTKVLEFIDLPRHSSSTKLLFPPRSSSLSDFGPFLDVKTVAIAFAIIVGISFLLQKCLRAFHKRPTRFFACQNYYVPLSTGHLYPHSAMNVLWYMRLIPRASSTTVIPRPRVASITGSLRFMSSRIISAVIPLQLPQRSQYCRVCNFVPGPLHWRPTQGCIRHEQIFAIGTRSIETQSMVRLVNIGMLSDPIAFLRLRLLRRPLYVQRIPSNSTVSRLVEEDVQSTCWADTSAEASYVLTPAIQVLHGLERVAVVDSRTVPWTVLVDCG